MKKLWMKLLEWLPIVWGILLTAIITLFGVVLVVAVIRLLLMGVGVI